MNLDHDLRKALSRKNPPVGFDRRMVERLRTGHTAQHVQPAPGRRQYFLPAAAAVMVLVGGAYGLHEWEDRRMSEQRAAAARATGEVTLALRIASHKLSEVQTKLQEFNRHDHPTKN